MEKRDKEFSVIVALGMLFIAVFSIFCPVEYFKHIADAIVLPLFLLTILETMGHIKTSALSALSHEKSKAEIHEMWLHREYDICKDDTDDFSQNTKREYEDLIRNIIKMHQSKIIIEKWFRFYTGLYILIGTILIASAVLANIPFMIEWTSNINVTAITLFTFVLFVIEPWIVEFFSYRLGQKVAINVNAWAKEKI